MDEYKIAITGAAGYIGSVLTARALEIGWKVVAVDSLVGGATGLLPVCTYPNLTILKKDLFELTERDLGDVQTIFHLASIVGSPACEKQPEEARRVNLHGTKHLLDLAPQAFMVFTNTNIGYPKGESDETAPLTATGIYSETKIEAEKMVLDNGGISLRLASVCGVSPKMRNDLLLNFLVKECVTKESISVFDVNSSRNFIHVKDVANGMINDAGNVPRGQAYNLALPTHYNKMELLEIIERALDRKLEVAIEFKEDPDKRDYHLSVKKWLSASNSLPAVSIEECVQELIKYYEFSTL